MNVSTLTIYERMILESIYRADRSYNELYEDLGLRKFIIQKTLNKLVLKGHIKVANDRYFPKLNSFELKEKINTKDNLMSEISFLQKSALKHTLIEDQSFVKLRKVFLNETEKKLLNGMLINIESFLNSVSNSGKTKDQTLVYWCQIPMEKIITGL